MNNCNFATNDVKRIFKQKFNPVSAFCIFNILNSETVSNIQKLKI